MIPMLPGITALMTLLFFFSRKNLFWSGTIGERILILMVLAVLFWIGVEQLAKFKLKLVIDSRYFTRLKKQFSKRSHLVSAHDGGNLSVRLVFEFDDGALDFTQPTWDAV